MISKRLRIVLVIVVILISIFAIYHEQQVFGRLYFPNFHDPPATQSTAHIVPPTSIVDDGSIDNLLRTEEQCMLDFPDLYTAIDASVSHYRSHRLQRGDLEKSFEGRRDELTWVVIRNNQLFVRSRHGGFQSRVQAVLADLHRAILTSPERLPDVEFVFNTADSAPSGKYTPAFGLSRGLKERAFLLADFGYWAWPEPYVNGFTEFENEVEKVEKELSWDEKKNQLFWRGAAKMNPEREHLVSISDRNNETWGNVRDIDWGNLKEDDRYEMADHCRFKFLAHIEGARYSARLKYLQHCNSVILTHKQKWTTHLSHLLITEGVEQNIIVVGWDFDGVEKVIEELLRNEEKAKTVARNSQETFGKRYGRLGAEVCYWRQLIRGYHSIMTPDFQRSVSDGYDGKGAKDYESVMLMGNTEWEVA